MSVIYATLERLESDHPVPSGERDETRRPVVTAASRGIPTKTAGAALVMLIVGAGVLLWDPVDEAVVVGKLSPLAAEYGSGVDDQPDAQLSLAEPGKPALTVRESTGSAGGTTNRQNDVAAQALPMESVVVSDGQHLVVTGASAQPLTETSTQAQVPAQPASQELAQAVEAPVHVAGSDAGPVAPPVAKTVDASTEPEAPQQMAAPAETPAADIDDAVEQARYALSSGRYQRALSALAVLESVPGNRADFWLVKGSAHLGSGQLDLAGEAFEAAQELAPDNAQIAVQLAILNQEKGDHDSALRILQAAAIRHPDVPEIFLNRGYSQQALGAVQEAKRSFREFLQMTEDRSLYLQQRLAVKRWLAQFAPV